MTYYKWKNMKSQNQEGLDLVVPEKSDVKYGIPRVDGHTPFIFINIGFNVQNVLTPNAREE